MKKIIYLVLLFTVLFQSKSFATVYTFTGTGNWSDVARWSPSVPSTIVENDTILINGNCTIPTGQFVEFGSDTSISSLISFQFQINDSLINNGDIFITGVFENQGVLINSGTVNTFASSTTSYIYNAGYLLNQGQIVGGGEMGGGFGNSGLIDNYGSISGEAGCSNNINGVINSYGGAFGSGPMGSTVNNGIINGQATFFRLQNNSTSLLSPGFGFSNTDTMVISHYFISEGGTINFDINSTTDKDLIIFNNVIAFDSLGNINVNINPSYTPNLSDTFVLFYKMPLPTGVNDLLSAKFNITLPPPPSGFIWKVIKEQNRIYFTMDFGLPELPTFFKFTAEKSNKTAVLKYKLFEKDNELDHFVIERASVDYKFNSIGEIKYDENNLEFNFIDANPFEGDNIYHIIAINKDGKSNKNFNSNAYLLSFNEMNGVVLNSIVENDLLLSLENSRELTIFNQVGDIVFSQFIENGQSRISLSHLTKGIYFVKVNSSIYKILKS